MQTSWLFIKTYLAQNSQNVLDLHFTQKTKNVWEKDQHVHEKKPFFIRFFYDKKTKKSFVFFIPKEYSSLSLISVLKKMKKDSLFHEEDQFFHSFFFGKKWKKRDDKKRLNDCLGFEIYGFFFEVMKSFLISSKKKSEVMEQIVW